MMVSMLPRALVVETQVRQCVRSVVLRVVGVTPTHLPQVALTFVWSSKVRVALNTLLTYVVLLRLLLCRMVTFGPRRFYKMCALHPCALGESGHL